VDAPLLDIFYLQVIQLKVGGHGSNIGGTYRGLVLRALFSQHLRGQSLNNTHGVTYKN